jgi:hypothetical protein
MTTTTITISYSLHKHKFNTHCFCTCVNLQTTEFCDLTASVLSGILTVISLSLKCKPYNLPLDQHFSDFSAWHPLKQPKKISTRWGGGGGLEKSTTSFLNHLYSTLCRIDQQINFFELWPLSNFLDKGHQSKKTIFSFLVMLQYQSVKITSVSNICTSLYSVISI